MNAAALLRPLKNLLCLLAGYTASLACADKVLCEFTEAYAVFIEEVGRALAHHFAQASALAVCYREVALILVEPVVNLFNIDLAGLILYRLLYGDGAHDGRAHGGETGDEFLKV